MHSVKFSMLLLLVLISPLILRKISFEPYPAILLPDGSNTISSTNGEVNFTFKEVYAIDRGNKWTKVNPTILFDPMPDVYTPSIIYNFLTGGKNGLSENSKKYKLLKYIQLVKKKPVDPHQPSQMNLWLKKRLLAHGFDASTVKINTVTIIASSKDGKLLRKETNNEKIISLD